MSEGKNFYSSISVVKYVFTKKERTTIIIPNQSSIRIIKAARNKQGHDFSRRTKEMKSHLCMCMIFPPTPLEIT